jgi:(p)ppGpp synthase/HD superfamily hydrolase
MMTKENFEAYLVQSVERIEKIRESAYELHRSVNQTYGDGLPYGYHLDMVANAVREFGYLVCADEDDIIPMLFAAYYHDSIEDARQTYNDVMKTALKWMKGEQALMATEIVYALTNDKGRTRAERAGEKYYRGIRETPYAPFVKLCDRLANISYSCSADGGKGSRMKDVYRAEMPHFLPSIDPHSDDIRFQVPTDVVEALAEILIDELERDEADRRWHQELPRSALYEFSV